jgi:hypothetical protein
MFPFTPKAVFRAYLVDSNTSQAMGATPILRSSIGRAEIKKDHKGRLFIATHKHKADGFVLAQVRLYLAEDICNQN